MVTLRLYEFYLNEKHNANLYVNTGEVFRVVRRTENRREKWVEHTENV